MRKQLNRAQWEAVSTVDGSLLVIAGPGSGKTRVIEFRTLYLVKQGISPDSILLLTFTRRAAEEMKRRASEHDIRSKRIEGGTFHSFGYNLIRKYHSELDMREKISVLDEGDASDALLRAKNSLGFGREKKKFPKKETLKHIISTSLNRNIPLSEILSMEYPEFEEHGEQIMLIQKRYERYKKESGYVDYDDLLLYSKRLLQNTRIQKEITNRYRYVMIDEFQDTNALQGDISYLLAEHHKNIMVVGDDAQCIYGFRGASHENIMKFPKIFSRCKVVKLETNYRSTQPILDLANAVLETMEDAYQKNLYSTADVSEEKPRMWYTKNPYEEAEWIASKIAQFQLQGIPLSHQAVLFRSSYVSVPLQAVLTRARMPYEVFGGLKFYEMAHVKDILAHLRVLSNIKDELAWARVLLLLEGVGEKTVERILEDIRERKSMKEILSETFKQYESSHIEKLALLFEQVSGSFLSLEDKCGCVLDYYNPIFKEKFDDWRMRLNDLQALRALCGEYDSCEKLVADLALERPAERRERYDRNGNGEILTLSTIHSAKGLEWEVVFLIGTADGILPNSLSLNSLESIEEEKRLFYVAITRPKKHLLLSFHERGKPNGSLFNELSRFIKNPAVFEKLESGRSDVYGDGEIVFE